MDPNTLIFSAPEHCVSNLLCCLAPQWYSKIPHIAYNHLYFNNRSTVWESSDPVFIMALFCFHRESLKLYHLMPRTTSLHAQRRPWNVWSLLSYPEHLFSVMPRCSFKFCQFTPSIPPLPIFPCLLPDTYTQPLSSPALSWKTADPLHSIWLFSLLLPILPRWDFLKKMYNPPHCTQCNMHPHPKSPHGFFALKHTNSTVCDRPNCWTTKQFS